MNKKLLLTACTASLLAQEGMALSWIPQLEYAPVDYVVNVLRSFAQGLKLYDHVYGLTTCDLDTSNFAATLVDSASVFYSSSGEPEVIREGIWLFTDSLGLTSYALRSCYDSYASLLELNAHYWEQLGGFYNAAIDIHDNIIASEEEINQ